jgi:hypothetical protein
MNYYKRIASSTQSDVMCRCDGDEATREAGGHKFESSCTRIFHVKNRVTCDGGGLPGMFKYFFLTLPCPPLSRFVHPFISHN